MFCNDYFVEINEKEIQLQLQWSSCYPAVHLKDTDFANDTALISNRFEKAQALLYTQEPAANCVGLYLNKTN